MVDVVGMDHVAIGTDLAGVSPRAALFTDWAEWPSIPAALPPPLPRPDPGGACP